MHDHSNIYGTLEPDVTKCRTSFVGATIPGTKEEMYYCRLSRGECKYAMAFGYDYLCKHPDSRRFLIREDSDPESMAPERRAGSRRVGRV
jgi:hypothetical protein